MCLLLSNRQCRRLRIALIGFFFSKESTGTLSTWEEPIHHAPETFKKIHWIKTECYEFRLDSPWNHFEYSSFWAHWFNLLSIATELIETALPVSPSFSSSLHWQCNGRHKKRNMISNSWNYRCRRTQLVA